MEPSFPQFRDLPAELRCKIWRMAIPRRIVSARLKLDLDAWNAATETDWMQVHYRVVPDDRKSFLNPVALVNHEARHEMTKNYKPLRISRKAVEKSLGTRIMDLDAFCGSSRIPWFNPEYDVLGWTEPKRWSTGCNEQPCPLFLAACLSVRYVEFKLDVSMNTQLEILAFAVLDRDQPLETLTIIVKEDGPRYRLTRRPPNSKFLCGKSRNDMIHVLSRSPVSLFPWCNIAKDPTQKPHPLVNRMLVEVSRPKQKPLGLKTRLGTRFAIYGVFDPDHEGAEEYVKEHWDVMKCPKQFQLAAGLVDLHLELPVSLSRK
ncbi:uncharacterized protein F4822DRAFT_388167 [Hypoxylon trugodes]|uniref:uncharacterized protein n=1 Tax=Hypoxylon trugodes TaxID=326681 RepID=UPI0021905F99|nr:uncharacterized protein F4822DRAFT_388167 [Hypoxylon trugodes]KAI1394435.1 hypothetical protein F4822DRAFT_388167 [Hypoxylon trugodes]